MRAVGRKIFGRRSEDTDDHDKHPKVHSIRLQLTVVCVLLVTLIIAICIIADKCFLERYYLNNKEDALKESYERINTASNEGSIESDEFDIELQNICNKYNISMIIMDQSTDTIKSSSNDSDPLSKQLLDHIFGSGTGTPDETAAQTEDGSGGKAGAQPGSGDAENKKNPPQNQKPETKSQHKVIEQNDSYTIQIIKDDRTKAEFIEMWGTLDNGYLFLVRSPLDSIRDSADISNHFLLYTGLFAIMLSIAISYFVSRKITEPIREITGISEKMKKLDFNAKYTGKNTNEIGVLGENINELSGTLEKTISELKTANNEMKKDLAQKEESEKMRQEFLSNVSHELKTPIALIQGYAEGLKDGITDDPESMNFYCDVITDEAGKMNNMVKKLLTLNQLEFGNDVVTMERFDIRMLIDNYIQTAGIQIKQHNVTVNVDGADQVFVWGDEFKTEEVFMNYFSNALNHVSGANQIKVGIYTDMENKKAHITVYNTGELIPDDSIDRLWEKFYKVDKARTREYGGSGVGLSIVKAIMESMNQKYGVRNMEDGVEFWFELELA